MTTIYASGHRDVSRQDTHALANNTRRLENDTGVCWHSGNEIIQTWEMRVSKTLPQDSEHNKEDAKTQTYPTACRRPGIFVQPVDEKTIQQFFESRLVEGGTQEADIASTVSSEEVQVAKIGSSLAAPAAFHAFHACSTNFPPEPQNTKLQRLRGNPTMPWKSLESEIAGGRRLFSDRYPRSAHNGCC